MSDPEPIADEPPVPPPTAGVSVAEVVCPSCGVSLTGSTIGQPCPSCGATIGQHRGLHTQAPASGKATASMVLGIVAITGCMFYGLPGVICGILAIVFAKQAREQIASGQASTASLTQASAGRICGIIGLVLGCIYMLLIAAYVVFIIWMIGQSANSNSPFAPQPVQPTPWSQPAPVGPPASPPSNPSNP